MVDGQGSGLSFSESSVTQLCHVQRGDDDTENQIQPAGEGVPLTQKGIRTSDSPLVYPPPHGHPSPKRRRGDVTCCAQEERQMCLGTC